MQKIEKECLNCQKKFNTEQRYIDRGHGKYCSIQCSSIFSFKQKPKKQNNTTCYTCSTSFYRRPSKLKSSKSGYTFCSRKCKEHAQSIYTGLNLKAIQPSHFGNSIDYRALAFSQLGNSCNRCGYSKYLCILEVHHKDTNRNNNNIENLEILCPTCHREEHFLTKTGFWHSR